jgi:hypothetical protein
MIGLYLFGRKTYKMSSNVIRIYNNNNTKHWSAVKTGGRILEVKNPDGPARGYFDTEEIWTSVCNSETDIPIDTHGFKYDWRRRSCCCWTNWLYDRIAELTPHLLARKDIRDGFNHMVDFFNKYDGKVSHHMQFGRHVMYGGWLYYSGYLPGYGLPFHFLQGQVGSYECPWTRVHDLWRPLRILLGDLILALENKGKVARLEIAVKNLRKRELVAKYRAEKYMRDLQECTKSLAEKEAQLAAL